ncbi:MAG: hypothetical protein WBV85_01190 [Solirubrobacteraceae bacterium]
MNLLLVLRFNALYRDPSLVEMADVLGDVEALYHAARGASDGEQTLLPLFIAERQTQSAQPPGLSDEVLAEIERGTRAIGGLEREGADQDTIETLRAAVTLLARRQTEAIYRGNAPGLPRPVPTVPLHVRSLSMASPLQILTSIPPEYWTGGSVALFLTAIERKFNFVKRIRTERLELDARQAKARAETSQEEVRDAEAQRALQQLRQRDLGAGERQLAGLQDQRTAFQLEGGEISREDPDRPGHPLVEKVTESR